MAVLAALATPEISARLVETGSTPRRISAEECTAFVTADVARWGAVTRADMEVLLAVPIRLPPLAEQRRIGDLLTRAAGIRLLREAALASARATIPALSLSMFGELCQNPLGFTVVPPEAVAEISSGLRGCCSMGLRNVPLSQWVPHLSPRPTSDSLRRPAAR
jgi:hypothetical protein